MCLHCYLDHAPIMQQVLMHFLLQTRTSSGDKVRILRRLKQELFAVEHPGRLEEATDKQSLLLLSRFSAFRLS
jgi:hypothetical protein